MFGRSKTKAMKEGAANASGLALELAQDKRFRKQLLSAIEQGSEAGRRARKGLGFTGAVSRLATDEELKSALKGARDDLQQAYGRLEKKRRTHKLRNLALIAALTSIAAAPRLRERIVPWIRNLVKQRERLADPVTDGASRPRDLHDLTKDELYARAQEADIPGRSEMSKDELVEALRGRS